MKIRPLKVELFHADRRTDRQTDMTKLKSPELLDLATASIISTILNSLVRENKNTNNCRVPDCTVTVALPLIAAGPAGSILTKSKGHSLYFRAFTVTTVLGVKKLHNFVITKHSKYTTNDKTKSKNGPGSSAPSLRGVRKTSIVASLYYLLFPALYLASRPCLPEGRAGIAWDHQSSTFSIPPPPKVGTHS
jgi:hypothetical protein